VDQRAKVSCWWSRYQLIRLVLLRGHETLRIKMRRIDNRFAADDAAFQGLIEWLGSNAFEVGPLLSTQSYFSQYEQLLCLYYE
jgi:hypothetical protein